MGATDPDKEASLAYALEENPYIEQPTIPAGRDLGEDFSRLEFDFRSEGGVKHYWDTLEYIYSKLDKEIAKKMFPGNALPEVLSQISFTE